MTCACHSYILSVNSQYCMRAHCNTYVKHCLRGCIKGVSWSVSCWLGWIHIFCYKVVEWTTITFYGVWYVKPCHWDQTYKWAVLIAALNLIDQFLQSHLQMHYSCILQFTSYYYDRLFLLYHCNVIELCLCNYKKY